MKMHPAGASGMNPPTLNDYGDLLKRSIKLFDGSEADGKQFLDTQLLRNQVDPDKLTGFDWAVYGEVAKVIHEMEAAARKAPRTRKKKEAPVPEEDLFSGVEPGVDPETGEVDLFASPAKEQALENADALIELAQKLDKEEAAKKPQPAPNAATNSQLPTQSAGNSSTPANACGAAGSQAEEKAKSAREILGIPEGKSITLETKEDVDRILKKRMLLFAELAYITEAYKEAKNHIESSLEAIEALWSGQLEAFRRMNPPATGKSLKLLYGELKLRDTAASVAYDEENDPGQRKFKAFLYTLPIDLREQLDVREVKDIVCNRDKFDKWYQQRAAELKAPPPVAGIKYTPAQVDKFFVSPSLDTVKDKIRKGTFQQ
jgi:hypothetical protein